MPNPFLGILFYPTKLRKRDTPRHVEHEIFVPAFDDKKLDSYGALSKTF